MINEMLRQMEANRARFIATTNRADILDPATSRRFSLAVEFLAMTTTQARALFWSTFEITPPTGLDLLVGLTPGDFAQAKKRADLLGEQNANTLMKWLASAAAGRGFKSRVGF